jgi:hypothetical protein
MLSTTPARRECNIVVRKVKGECQDAPHRSINPLKKQKRKKERKMKQEDQWNQDSKVKFYMIPDY